MRFYWDTTAAINAAISPAVCDRLNQGERFTRSHTFWEFFSTILTRNTKDFAAVSRIKVEWP